jgi:hypothetical protein
MRVARILAAIACIATLSVPRAAAAQGGRAAASDDLDRARALDQQGVRAFREGRYNDAIRYFEEAFKLGGPSSELWNVARCEVKLDEPEAAADSLTRYLARTDLSADDRAGAKRELDELSRRRSTVTIASSPTGAFVAIDGKRIGRTPTSADVAPGEHAVAVQREGYPPHVETVTARYGRAIIVDAILAGGGGGGGASSSSGLRTDPDVSFSGGHRFSGSAEFAGMFARLGSLGRPLYPAALLGLGVVAYETPAAHPTGWDVVAGLRFTFTDVSWTNGVRAPALSCGLGGDEEAAVLAAFADAELGYRPAPRWRVGGDAGFGFAGLPARSLGGDAFTPTCAASPGLVPAGHFGADVSYRVAPALRLVLAPIVFEVEPAFGGARTAPIDATGAWLRVGAGFGLAVDL